MTDEIPSSSSSLIREFEPAVLSPDPQHEDDNYSPARNDETLNDDRVPSMDEITQNGRENPRTSIIPDFGDSDDDEDQIQVIINKYEPQISTFHINRPMMPANLMHGQRTNPGRGMDSEIKDQLTQEDEDKPWKKPGADVSDYFNFGFTEETWMQYCDRHRRLRAENNLARLPIYHMPPGPPMGYSSFPNPMMMVNRPINMQVVPRPMNIQRPDGRIGVIGTIDQTSRRPMLDRSSSINESSPFSSSIDRPSNEEIIDDSISAPTMTNGHVPNHGIHPNYPQHIAAIGANRVPLIGLQPNIPYRPPFAPMYAMPGPRYFPRGPIMGGMHGERPPQPYLIPQQTWNESPMVSQPDFPSESTNTGRSSRSATPEEKPTTSTDQNEKSFKDDRYKERNDRNHRSQHRHDEYDYDRSSRKRHYRDDRSHSSSRRTPTKTNSTRNDSSPISNNQSESMSDSRRSDHRKSSKRSRRDSSDERRNRHHHERSSHSKKNSRESYTDKK